MNNETPIAFNSSSSNKDEWWDFYDGQYNSFEGYSDLKSVDTSSAKEVYKKSMHKNDTWSGRHIQLGDFTYDIYENTIFNKEYFGADANGYFNIKLNKNVGLSMKARRYPSRNVHIESNYDNSSKIIL